MQILFQTQIPKPTNYFSPNFEGRKPMKNLGNDVVVIGKKLTDFQKKKMERENTILQKLFAGYSRKEVAQEMGISMNKVIRAAEKNNAYAKITEARNARIIDKLQKGFTIKEIAKEENIERSTVKRVSKKYKVSPATKIELRRQAIENDLKKGVSVAEIATKQGLTEATVRRRKAQLGLTRKYHFVSDPKGFSFNEIKEESRKITELRENYRKFKLGERTPEILEKMEQTLTNLLAKIQEFKSRV